MNDFKGEEINEKIERVIMSKVFPSFSERGGKGFEKGKRILNKLYLQYFNSIDDLETKRLIAYNLALAEYQTDNKEGAKKIITEIKNEVEKDNEYIEAEKVNYGRILNLHNELYKSEMNEDELKGSYNKIAQVYKEVGAFEEYAVTIANIYTMDKQYNKTLELLKKVIELKDEKVSYYSMELLKEIKDNSLHNKALDLIKEANIEIG